MARKCEDMVPETNKTNFTDCKKSINLVSSSGLGGNTNSSNADLAKTAVVSPTATSSKLDEEADEILSLALNKIDSPPPPLRSNRKSRDEVGSEGSTNGSSGRRKQSPTTSTTLILSAAAEVATGNSSTNNNNPNSNSKTAEVTSKSSVPANELNTSGATAATETTVVVDDLGSTDEVKVFKDEGDRDDEKMSVEHNLLEEKSSLIDFTENEEKIDKRIVGSTIPGESHPPNTRYHLPGDEQQLSTRSKSHAEDKRCESAISSMIASHHHAAAANAFNMGYHPFVSPYSTYSNGDHHIPMANKIGIPPFFCYNTNSSEPSHSLSVAPHHLATPPPAHCGIPPYQLDAKGIAGLTSRSSSAASAALYAATFGPPNHHHHQYPPSAYAMLGADLGNNWPTAPSVYSSVVAAAASAGFRNSGYPPPPHDFASFRFSHLIPPQSSVASSVASANSHHSYVGQFPHQLPASYSLAGLQSSPSQVVINPGSKQTSTSISTSSMANKSNKYLPTLSSPLTEHGLSSQVLPGKHNIDNTPSSTINESSRSKEGGSGGGSGASSSSSSSKLMSSFGRGDVKVPKQSATGHSLPSPSSLQGMISKAGSSVNAIDNDTVELNIHRSLHSGNNPVALYQPYDMGVARDDKDKVTGSNSNIMLGHHSLQGENSNSSTGHSNHSNINSNSSNNNSNNSKKPHIKKPLNAFMLYMKEMRANVVAECTLKESAAINQILGRRWHSLSREEQSKYYEKARQERQLHMEMYPGWSARDNYGFGSKKKKRKKDRGSPSDINSGNSMKKCRARYGLDQQNQWCKPCRRKKKCVKYMEMLMNSSGGGSHRSPLSGNQNIHSPNFNHNEFDGHHNDDDEEDDDDDEDNDDDSDDEDDDEMVTSERSGGGNGVIGNQNPSSIAGHTQSPDQLVSEKANFGSPAALIGPSVGAAANLKQERDSSYKDNFEENSSNRHNSDMKRMAALSSFEVHYGNHPHAQFLLDHHHHHQQQQQNLQQLHSNQHPLINALNRDESSFRMDKQNGGLTFPFHNGSSVAAAAAVGARALEINALHHHHLQLQQQHIQQQQKHSSVCFPPSPAASSSSSLTTPINNTNGSGSKSSNGPGSNNNSMWLASSPMLMTPATLSGSDQSPQRQTPTTEETSLNVRTKNEHGGSAGLIGGGVQKKKKRRRKRKANRLQPNNGGFFQQILLKAIFTGNGDQITNADKEKVIEFIESFFKSRTTNSHRVKQLIAIRLGGNGKRLPVSCSVNGAGPSQRSDSSGDETDDSSSSSAGSNTGNNNGMGQRKLPFTISAIIG